MGGYRALIPLSIQLRANVLRIPTILGQFTSTELLLNTKFLTARLSMENLNLNLYAADASRVSYMIVSRSETQSEHAAHDSSQ